MSVLNANTLTDSANSTDYSCHIKVGKPFNQLYEDRITKRHASTVVLEGLQN